MYYFIRNAFLFYDKTITAILQQDFSASYSDAYKTGNYSKLYQLYETLKERGNEQTSKELVYRTILNNIDSGVLILEKKEGVERHVRYCDGRSPSAGLAQEENA